MNYTKLNIFINNRILWHNNQEDSCYIQIVPILHMQVEIFEKWLFIAWKYNLNWYAHYSNRSTNAYSVMTWTKENNWQLFTNISAKYTNSQSCDNATLHAGQSVAVIERALK